ncbi:MAG TPA: asparagine synthase (glutamine-hydrolyzing), partial [Acidimicrobiales bacterium]|nr:asparagine synthase (glutamine-hydrolyzing) [Acidimicrobiales bacterium]
MCGIAGLLDPRGARATELERLASDMSETLRHRGPDDSGLWVDGVAGVALASRRLAVVGLGPGGHQPMSSADRRWTLAFNGEIYNFASLRRRLEADGTRLRGGSDTEVLLEAIAAWGITEAVDSSEGMFAFAAWDAGSRELHLARDRFGEKPLYWGWAANRFVFASELKAVRALPGFAAHLDRTAVAAFLRHNCVPAPRSIYQGISKLEPGQMLTVGTGTPVGGRPVTRRYWSARTAVEGALRAPLIGPDEMLVDMLGETLQQAVADRMEADVPVGAFLSGGVDSSVVVALMQQHSARAVKTFTVGFSERTYDESQDAAKVAAHLGTDHTTLVVTERQALEVIPELAAVWDEPFADNSQIPMLLVSRLARSQVTVALSGDAGDELFAGYNRHVWLERLWRRSAWLPAGARQMAGGALRRVPPGAVNALARFEGALPARWRIRIPATELAKAGKVIAASDPRRAYLALVSHWERPEDLVIGAGADGSLAARPESWPELGTVTEQMLWLDLVGYLPDDVLTKVDRATMAASLESRLPFLDRGVVELAWRFPTGSKLRGGTTK